MKVSFKSILLETAADTFLVAQSGVDSKSLGNPKMLSMLNGALAKVTSEPYLTPYMAFGSMARILAHANIILPQRVFFDLSGGEVVLRVDHIGKAFGPGLDGQYNSPGDGEGYYLYFCYEQKDNGWYTVFAEIVDAAELDALLKEDESLDEALKPGDKVHLGFGAKGGAGFRGTVKHSDDNETHIQADPSPMDKWGPKSYRGPTKFVTKEESENIEESAPPGMENVVQALKKKFPKGSSSPFAIAWAMHHKEQAKTPAKVS